MKKYKRTVRGEIKYVLDVMHHGKRRRKYFSSFLELRFFENNGLKDWLSSFEDHPDGYNTSVSVGIKSTYRIIKAGPLRLCLEPNQQHIK